MSPAQPVGADMYRILSSNGSKTTTELVELAVRSKVQVKSLSVQNTTLDDALPVIPPHRTLNYAMSVRARPTVL